MKWYKYILVAVIFFVVMVGLTYLFDIHYTIVWLISISSVFIALKIGVGIINKK